MILSVVTEICSLYLKFPVMLRAGLVAVMLRAGMVPASLEVLTKVC